jgi:hypothetical protein
MENLCLSIGLEALYQVMLTKGAKWSRKHFFKVGRRIAANMEVR